MGLLFLLIVPSFVLFGLDGYNREKDNSVVVARVDGQDIVQSEWDRAHLRESERLRASMPSLDAKLLDSPEARFATLERLVRDRVLAAAAIKFKLAISDQRLARELNDNPEIAALRRPDGSLDMERYRQLLGSQGMSPELFEAGVRSDLSNRQVLFGVAGSGFSSSVTADMALKAYFEKREIEVVRFLTSDFAAKLMPSEDDVEKFYKANEKLFQAPEQANIEYVLLDVEAIKKGLTVNEVDLKAYYEQNAKRLSGAEQRRASHILLASSASATAEDRLKAKAKAIELLAAIRKSPESFAELAQKNSQDTGSALNGGDLDFFARGAMVKPFEDTAFSMRKGEISDVVESEFGYHIIRLTDIKTPPQRSYEEMKPELEADVRKQQAQKQFSELAEAFTNGVYEQADSLKPIADRLKLEIRTATGVLRQPAPGVSGPLANIKFLNAIFSPDAIEKKRNTEAVTVAPNQLISGRVTQYTSTRVRPLAEVKEDVRKRWLAMRGAEDARKEGIAKLAAWKLAPAASVLSEKMIVSRDQPEKNPTQVVDAVLRADVTTLPAFVGVDLGQQGYTIVKVVKVMQRTPPAETTAKQERSQYAQWWTSAESLAYYNALQERFKTEFKVAKPKLVKADAETGLTN